MDESPFTVVDRDLLKRCLNREPGSWNDFVDRFLSLIYHTIGYTAHLRSVRVAPEDLEDIAAEVLLRVCADNFKLLREFRKECSLATYLAVVARRVCVHELARRQQVRLAINNGETRLPEELPDDAPAAQKGLESLEEVEKLLRKLKGKEREIVRLYYLEGRTYEEISTETDVPVNNIGALLSRVRKKLRATMATSGEVPVLAPEQPKPKQPGAVRPTKPTKSKPKPNPVPDRTEVTE